MISPAPSSTSVQPVRTLRLGAAGTLMLGTVGTLSAANTTNGTVVFNDSPGITSTRPAAFGEQNIVYFDVNGDGNQDFLVNAPQFGSAKGLFAPDAFADMPMYITAGDALLLGDIVGPDQTFMYYSNPPDPKGPANSVNMSASEAYYGFSFVDGSTRYGWIRFSNTTAAFTVLEWAFDTSGASIAVGATASAIPEASTTTAAMGAAALLAGSMAAWRRRKARNAVIV